VLNDKQLKKIREFSVDLSWNFTFGGNAIGNMHLFRTLSIAKKISANYDVDLTVVEAGVWLHDTNLEKNVIADTLANKDKIIEFLTKIGVSELDREKIIWCVESHDGRIPAKSIESKIVHDADTLEKMGPLGVIRETWKKCQAGWNTERIALHLKKHIKFRENKLYTKEAKKNAININKSLDRFFDLLDIQLLIGEDLK
jgi:HD superfamily phosphodiesterase